MHSGTCIPISYRPSCKEWQGMLFVGIYRPRNRVDDVVRLFCPTGSARRHNYKYLATALSIILFEISISCLHNHLKFQAFYRATSVEEKNHLQNGCFQVPFRRRLGSSASGQRHPHFLQRRPPQRLGLRSQGGPGHRLRSLQCRLQGHLRPQDDPDLPWHLVPRPLPLRGRPQPGL